MVCTQKKIPLSKEFMYRLNFGLKKPHKRKLLYGKGKFCKFKDFKIKTKLFLCDIK